MSIHEQKKKQQCMGLEKEIHIHNCFTKKKTKENWKISQICIKCANSLELQVCTVFYNHRKKWEDLYWFMRFFSPTKKNIHSILSRFFFLALRIELKNFIMICTIKYIRHSSGFLNNTLWSIFNTQDLLRVLTVFDEFFKKLGILSVRVVSISWF